ncbi:hypothetical protein GP480_03575 [Neorickettsia findlayensis]|uniref:Uncharacterized protein n=2 Tax=Neorickettsia findlayensis TaxID=2686014 RepID=A0A6P1GCY5_9RICK|nr:hypothetical protein GP480_03575 [Neorickettsia findlayensis]
MDFINKSTEENFDYEEALLILKEAADGDRRIIWSKNAEAKKITRYDLPALQQETSQPRNLLSSHDYLQQAINMCRGADEIAAAMLENPAREKVRRQLKKKALVILETGLPRYNEDACRKSLKRFNTEVCEMLQRDVLPSLPLNEISELLRKAEAYAPIGDRVHFSVSTITRIGDNIISQTDVPITGTTGNQKQLLLHYAHQSWYLNLHPVEQALFRKHADVLLEDDRVLSTYLRCVPGLRNAYTKTLEKLTVDDSGNVTNKIPLTSYTHSASLAATHSDGVLRLQLAHENYQQLCRAHPGKNVHMLTLCSRVPMQGFIDRFFPKLSSNILDTYVVDTTKKAVGENNTHVIPVNSLRCISRNTISKTCDVLIGNYVQKAGISTRPEYQDLLRYLTQPTSTWSTRAYRQACGNVSNLAAREERALAKEMVELRRLELKQSGFSGRVRSLCEVITSPFRSTPRNRNARIAAKVTALWEQVCDNDVLCVSCKSGKDRTGYVTTSADAITCAMNTPELKPEIIQRVLVNASHAQFLASHHGGKTGCFGLKTVQTDAFEGIGRNDCASLFTSAARSSSSIALLNPRGTYNFPWSQTRSSTNHTRTESTASSSNSVSTQCSLFGDPDEELPETDLIDLTVQQGMNIQNQESQGAER